MLHAAAAPFIFRASSDHQNQTGRLTACAGSGEFPRAGRVIDRRSMQKNVESNSLSPGIDLRTAQLFSAVEYSTKALCMAFSSFPTSLSLQSFQIFAAYCTHRSISSRLSKRSAFLSSLVPRTLVTTFSLSKHPHHHMFWTVPSLTPTFPAPYTYLAPRPRIVHALGFKRNSEKAFFPILSSQHGHLSLLTLAFCCFAPSLYPRVFCTVPQRLLQLLFIIDSVRSQKSLLQ